MFLFTGNKQVTRCSRKAQWFSSALSVTEKNIDIGKLKTYLARQTSNCFNRDEAVLFRDYLKDLCSINSPASAPMLINAAHIISRAAHRGFFSPNGEVVSQVIRLIQNSVQTSDKIHGVFLARSIRVISLSVPSHPERDIVESLIKKLAFEITKPERIESFTAMDLVEIIHSAATILGIRGLDEWGEIENIMFALLSALFTEFIHRSDYINIRLEKRNISDKQWISIQAVSNILFSASVSRNAITTLDFMDLTSSLAAVCGKLLMQHSDKAAFQSCQPFHIISILRSFVRLSPSSSPHEILLFRKLLAEFLRKPRMSAEAQELDLLLGVIEERWDGGDIRTRGILKFVRDRIHQT